MFVHLNFIVCGAYWKLPQEIEIEARAQEFEIADKEWRKKIKMWLDNIRRDNKRAGESLEAIQAIRDDERAAELLGVNLTFYKVFVFVTGAGIAGLAGALYANYNSFVTLEDAKQFGATPPPAQ